MPCRTPSVQRVADKTTKAKDQLDKLDQMIKDQDNANKTAFYDKINSHLRDANISDAREIIYSSDVKTEYTHEFSLDKIAAVVTSALLEIKRPLGLHLLMHRTCSI